MKKFILAACFMVMTLGFAGCTSTSQTTTTEVVEETTTEEVTTEETTSEEVEVPTEIVAVKERSIQVAMDAAGALNGEWADTFQELVESGLAQEHPAFAGLTSTLSDLRVSSGAYYLYTMVPAESGDYAIILDGSEEPDDYGTEYHFEIQFKEAFEDGIGAAARSAWDNGENDLVWSAFYPIHNSNGEIVAIVGVDFPAPEALDFPEWNRNSEVWNGIVE